MLGVLTGLWALGSETSGETGSLTRNVLERHPGDAMACKQGQVSLFQVESSTLERSHRWNKGSWACHLESSLGSRIPNPSESRHMEAVSPKVGLHTEEGVWASSLKGSV